MLKPLAFRLRPKSLEEIIRDTERDNYMTAEEALEYGLIDGIMSKRN
jgi:ATP-dependent Clp protease protease subunit